MRSRNPMYLRSLLGDRPVDGVSIYVDRGIEAPSLDKRTAEQKTRDNIDVLSKDFNSSVPLSDLPTTGSDEVTLGDLPDFILEQYGLSLESIRGAEDVPLSAFLAGQSLEPNEALESSSLDPLSNIAIGATVSHAVRGLGNTLSRGRLTHTLSNPNSESFTYWYNKADDFSKVTGRPAKKIRASIMRKARERKAARDKLKSEPISKIGVIPEALSRLGLKNTAKRAEKAIDAAAGAVMRPYRYATAPISDKGAFILYDDLISALGSLGLKKETIDSVINMLATSRADDTLGGAILNKLGEAATGAAIQQLFTPQQKEKK